MVNYPTDYNKFKIFVIGSFTYLTNFILQYSPHIVQGEPSSIFSKTVLSIAYSACFVQSRFFLAIDISLSLLIELGLPLATSAACAAIFDVIIPCLTCSTLGKPRCSLGVT